MGTNSEKKAQVQAGRSGGTAPPNESLDSGSGPGKGNGPTARATAVEPRQYVVGTNLSGHPHRRNFLSLPLQKYDFKLTRSKDLFALVQNRYVKQLLRWHPHASSVLAHLYYDFDASGCHLLHFINSVSLGHTPWVTTFETIVPFWGWHTELMSHMALRCLASTHCRKLIAMSNRAYEIQTNFFLRRYPEYRDDIAAKTCVIHPAQRTLVSDYGEKRLEKDNMVFTMVGRQFFMKGGMEVLRVFDQLLTRGYPIRLNIVSAMQDAQDPKRMATTDDVAAAKRIINRHPERIRHWGRLPNDKVLELLRDSHVGLLPTHYDSYGFSVLEAQASACPVIITDAVALPEFNSDEVGWVINVDKDACGTPLYSTVVERRGLHERIEAGLAQAILEIVNNPEVIQRKGLKALERICRDHDPIKTAEKLESIYDSITLG